MRRLLLFSFLAFCSVANGQIIDFPDANFKRTLVDTFCIDTNGDGFYDMDADPNNDGEVDLNEALQVNNLGLEFRSISNLNGIEHFKNLEKLVCAENNIKILDLEELKNLKLLNCYGNELTTINVKGLRKLIEFACDQNQLTNLDVGDLTNLEYLYCDYNQLIFLNVDNLTNLKHITCTYNKFIVKPTYLRINKNGYICRIKFHQWKDLRYSQGKMNWNL